MSHFAKVLNGKVVQVIVAEQEFFETFIDTSPGEWIQTSYNTHGGHHPEGRQLRKNFACVGFSYDIDRDAFIPPKPYQSWILNEETCLWDPPVPYPADGDFYTWDEETLAWIKVEEPNE